MRKAYLSLLTLISVGLLAGCGTSKSGNDDGFVIEEGDAVLTDAIIAENYNDNKAKVEAKDLIYENFSYPTGYTVVSYGDTAQNYGCVVLRKDNKYGVYSVFGKKMLISARLANQPSLYYLSKVGCYIRYIDTNNKEYWADGFGNVLLKAGEKEIEKDTVSLSTFVVNKKLYLKLSYYTYNYAQLKEVYYGYDENNVASVLENVDGIYTVEDTNKPGEIYVTATKKYDFDGGYAYTTANVLQVNRNSGSNWTVELPSDCHFGAFFADKFIYQRYGHIDDYNNGRYTVYTKYIDLKADEVTIKDLDINAVMLDLKELKTSSADLKLAAVTLDEVRSDGSSGASRTMIMDDEFKFHEDITKKNFASWIRLSNGYFYNNSYGELYDSNFKFVTKVSYSYNDKYEIFTVYDDDAKGYVFLDNTGKVIASGYQNFYSMVNTKIMKMSDSKSGGVHYYNLSTYKETVLENINTDKRYVSESVAGDLLILRTEYTINDYVQSNKTFTLKGIDGTSLRIVNNYQDYYGFSGFTIYNGSRFLFGEITYGISNSSTQSVYCYLSDGVYQAQEIVAPAA